MFKRLANVFRRQKPEQPVKPQCVILIEEHQEVVSHGPLSIAELFREYGFTGCGKFPKLIAGPRRKDDWRRQGKRPARKEW